MDHLFLIPIPEGESKNGPWSNKIVWDRAQFCVAIEREALHLKQPSIREGRRLKSSGFGSGKLLNDKVLYLEPR